MKLCVLLVCLTACWSTGAYADQSQTKLVVSAQVVPAARLTAVSLPSSMLVTTRDLERGVKRLVVHYRVSGNSVVGYLLHLAPHIGLTTSMVVHGLPGEVVVVNRCTDVSLPPSATNGELALEIELRLNSNATTGRYPLPLDFSVSPIPAAG